MSISAINPTTPTTNKHKHIAVKYTGYGALGFGIASGIVAKNHKIKQHKYLAYIAGALAVAHAAIVEYFHHKKKNG